MNDIIVDDVLHAPPFIIEPYKGTYLIIDPEAPNWINVNQYGLDALRMVDGHKTTRRIAVELTHTWQRSEESVTNEIVNFFNDIFKIGILAKEPFRYLPYTGRHKYLDFTDLKDLSISLSTKTVFSGNLNQDNESLRLSEKNALSLIDQAIDLGCCSVIFTGGEPFLLDYFPALIKKYADDGLLIRITTDADLIPDNLLAELSSNINFIVSLQGSSPKLNDAMRGDGSFNAAICGLNKLIDAGFNPIVQITLSSANLNDIVPLAELMASMGVKNIKLNWQRQSHILKDLSKNDNVINTRALLSVLRRLAGVTDMGGINLLNNEFINASLYRRRVKLDLCSGGVDSLAIFADGDSYPCYWLYGREQFKLGSIYDHSLKEIWQDSKELNELRRNSVQKNYKCYLCHLKYFCGGLAKCYTSCAHIMADNFGNCMNDNASCQTFKKIIYHSLRAQTQLNKTAAIDYPMILDSVSGILKKNDDLNSINYSDIVKSYRPFYV